jgi:hypothetical protein
LGDIVARNGDNGNGREALQELGNALEALVNVLYLIRLDRRDPARVLEWVELAEIQTRRMEGIREQGSGGQIWLR